ncbi:MAK16 [Cordylochernes scorpioides]|uniref:MAK16 n=1 Tax=Cordylochernes scorpioides TaxID=51811 RepID=A0ABY6K086_9ARAC|nr:MAK16 [Cordylochernes scorpioides]
MQQDDITWTILKNNFCSYKIKAPDKSDYCKNEYNVTGQCNRSSCPLSNSNYATVREEEGLLFLYIKTIERAAFPSRLWEKIKLPKNYEAALDVIDKELIYWPRFNIRKCKQRYTVLTKVLMRTRKQILRGRQKKLIPIRRKVEKREKGREVKALRAARIENNISNELVERSKQGIYGELYSFNQPETSKEKEDEEMESDFEDAELDEEERQYLAAEEFEESDEDIEDIAEESDEEESDEEEEEEELVKLQKRTKKSITQETNVPGRLKQKNYDVKEGEMLAQDLNPSWFCMASITCCCQDYTTSMSPSMLFKLFDDKPLPKVPSNTSQHVFWSCR